MALKIMNHLEFVPDITQVYLDCDQRIGPRSMTSGFTPSVVSQERPPHAMRPGASGPRTFRGPCDYACGVDRWAGPVQRGCSRCCFEN
jgi:hypothetical protein